MGLQVLGWPQREGTEDGAGQRRYLKTGICSLKSLTFSLDLKSNGEPLLKACLSSSFQSPRSTTAGLWLLAPGSGRWVNTHSELPPRLTKFHRWSVKLRLRPFVPIKGPEVPFTRIGWLTFTALACLQPGEGTVLRRGLPGSVVPPGDCMGTQRRAWDPAGWPGQSYEKAILTMF